MELFLLHPSVALRDCGDCQKYQYDNQTGERLTERDGSPMLRVLGCPPPCRTFEGCPKGTPEAEKGLSEMNVKAYIHYLECRAVGSFPADPLVRANAAIIRAVEDSVHRQQDAELMLLGMSLRGGQHG